MPDPFAEYFEDTEPAAAGAAADPFAEFFEDDSEPALAPVPQDQFVGPVMPADVERERRVERFRADTADYGQVPSLMAGAADAATLGFADEISGAVQAPFRAIADGQTLGDAYREGRQESAQAIETAMAASPAAAAAGGVVGGLLVPGPGTLGALKAARAIPQAVRASRVGKALAPTVKATAATAGDVGAYAAGTSDADLTRGEFGEFAGDVAAPAAGFGAGMGALAGAGSLARGAGRAAKPLGAYAARTFLGADPRAIRRYQQRMAQIDALAKAGGADYEQLAVNLRNKIGRLYNRASKGSSDSFDVLAEDAMVDVARAKRNLLNRRARLAPNGRPLTENKKEVAVIDGMLSNLEALSATRPQAAKLRQRAESLRAMGYFEQADALAAQADELASQQLVPARDAKRFIQAADRVERGKGFEPGTYIPEAARAARSARRAVDRNLKADSPEYAEIMRDVSADTGAATRASDLIGKKSEGTGADYLRGLLFKDTRRKHDIARLRAVDKRLGTEGQATVDTAMDQAALDMFGNANTQGSRRVLAGGAIGNEFGPAGRIAGVVTGLTGDIYGARLARGTIRGGVKLSDSAERILRFVPAMQAQAPRAARVLQQAMRDRENPERAVVVTDFVLRQQDPEYRALREHMDAQEAEEAQP